jgi:hypothetical protein
MLCVVCFSIDLLVYSYFLSCVPSLIPFIVLMLQLIVFWNFAILICVYQMSAYCYTNKYTDALTMFAKINNLYFTLGLVCILVDIITHNSLRTLLSLFSLSVLLCQNNTRHIMQEIIRVYVCSF